MKLGDSLGMYLEWIGLEQWQENRNAPETGVVRNGGVVTNTGVQRKPIADWKLLNEVLGGKSPRERAAELIAGTKLQRRGVPQEAGRRRQSGDRGIR